MRRFLTDAAVVALAHFIGALTALLTQVAITRAMPVRLFGAFALAQAYVLLFESIFVPRSGEIAMQLIGKAWHQQPGYVAALAHRLRSEEFKWNSAITLGAAGIAIVAHSMFHLDVAISVALSFSVVLQSGYGVSNSVVVVSDRIRQQALFAIAIGVITFVAVAVGVKLLGVKGAVAGYLAGAAVKTIWCYVWSARVVRKHCVADPAANDVVRYMKFGSLSAAAIWRNACQAAAGQADILLLGSALGNNAVATYRAAKSMAAVPARAVAPVWGAMRPRLVKALGQGEYRRLTAMIVLPGAVVLTVGAIAFPLLNAYSARALEVMFTASYRDAADPMVRLAVGAWIFSGVSGWLGFLAIVTERKLATTLLYTLYGGAIVIGGVLARHSVSSMANAVCIASVGASIVAWGWFGVSIARRSADSAHPQDV